MVIIQMIDNLDAGGAEIVAVNFATLLHNLEGVEVILVVSRGGVDGQLMEKIHPKLKVELLHKRTVFDYKAFKKLINIFKNNDIKLVHAHSTSFFWPTILKPFFKFKIVWHDHFGGKINNLGIRPYPYKIFSLFFDAVFCVSHNLLKSNRRWLLNSRKSIFWMPNYVTNNTAVGVQEKNNRIKTIICVANLRPQKDHLTLIEAFHMLLEQASDIQLLLIGNISDEKYFEQINELIYAKHLADKVQIITNNNNPWMYLHQADVAVLSSKSEGMPLALLEYGYCGLPVVCTAVGEMPYIIGDDRGWIVPYGDSFELSKALAYVLANRKIAKERAENLRNYVATNFSEDAVRSKLMEVYNNILINK
ncbi:MAG: glycosyltransferase [Chitinophagaceae bacterium]|nr:glycosyltransferase [Chitinophagaceae bacterium]